MKIDTKRRINQAVAFVAAFCTLAQPTYALNLATEPLFLANRVPPKVMITLSKDQQLYKKAYNDYSDLDGDGSPEVTYKHSITYYGYFDPTKCYNYATANGRFEPVSITTFTVTVNGQTKPGSAYCDDSSGRWSGNFLNWVSMSRMDAVRKLLYGGTRSTDTATDTTLERAFIPTDAHAWAKYYNGSDISRLTPFTSTIESPAPFDVNTSASFTLPATNQDISINFTTNFNSRISKGDQMKMQIRGQPGRYLYGTVMDFALIAGTFTQMRLRINAAGVVGAGQASTQWTLTNLSTTGISFCNLTVGTGTSQANTNPPLIRVAQGNFALWSANELKQCQWFEERNGGQSGFGGVGSNGNQVSLSEMDASAENPSRTKHGLGTGSAQGEYIARVQACVSAALTGSEKCTKYGANLKPTGLLQSYADTIEFGLMTGSYAKNVSGGVLRKAVGSFNDEINANGTFNTSTAGIVKTLNALRIYGYDYPNGWYLGSGGDNCTYQLTSITENQCTSWGNPMSEIYYEAVRYFAAKTDNAATPAYTYATSGAKDTTLGLPLQTWKAPMNSLNACSKLNVLVFNASVSTNDDDLRNTVAADINSNKTVRELANIVGDLESVTNGSFFIGKRVSDDSTSPGFELCTQKTVTALGDVSGICPEGPTLGGSYLLAGIARHARTTPIRADLANTGNDSESMKITSYGIQLATNTPQLEIPVPTKPGQKIVLQPIYRLVLPNGTFGGGALVDMKYVRTSVSGTRSTGKVYINWEDSEQGGDYDQDMWGTLEWDLDAATNTVKITTNAISASTSNPQGFGYTIAGTTADGPHFHSGILGFNFTDTVVAQPANFAGCNNCQVSFATSGQRGAQTVTYTLDATKSTTAGSLKDPLWYLSKYGGFDDRNRNGQLDGNEWDLLNNLTGAAQSDGIPDTYFQVTNPLGLESALERAFRTIARPGSASAVASSSASIRAGTTVFTARFRSGEWSGQFSAFKLNPDGTLRAEEWEASAKLPTPDKRVILTYRNDTVARKGVPFRWPANPAAPGASEVGTDLVSALNMKTDNTGASDGRGQERLSYLRGDASREGNALDSFRIRSSKLGDIINSTPVFVPEVPNDVVLDPTYVEFQKPFLTNKRPPMVYVAANDGMLHGFDASVSDASGTPSPSGGAERIAYVPSKTFSKLNQLTNPNYVHQYYVDGSPAVSDAKVGGNWKTVLVGALGAGGRGLYALDVTNPPNLPAADATDSQSVESTAAAKVLWEFNVEDDVPAAGKPKYGLGYVFGTPLIRKMNSPSGKERWAAIVSGGYNNTEVVPGTGESGDGKGYIFVIFLDGPSKKLPDGRVVWEEGVDYIRLSTTNGTAASPNAMAPPFAVDANSDGTVDYIYAGDLQGFLWKFDVSSTNATTWDSSSSKVVLFKAVGPTGVAQPITTAATGVIHPTGAGFLLLFGTGKYLEPTDPSPPFVTQTFYGVWDKNDKPNAISGQTTVPSRNVLFQQVIAEGVKTNPTTGGTTTFRYITQPVGVTRKAPDWSTEFGWYMDLLIRPGERVVVDPVVVSRRLLFSTLVPSGGVCDFGGTSFIMAVNAGTGGEFDVPVLDTNFDGKLTKDDTVVEGHFAAGFESPVGITASPKVLLGGTPKGETASGDTTLLFSDNTGRVAGAGNRRAGVFICGASGQCAPPMLLGAGRDSGRATWREVVKK